jgi:hypothetical protein
MLYQALLFLRKLQFSRHQKEIERGKQPHFGEIRTRNPANQGLTGKY